LKVANGSEHHTVRLADVALDAAGEVVVTISLVVVDFENIVFAVIGQEQITANPVFIFG
jgi:hypothetical protein